LTCYARRQRGIRITAQKTNTLHCSLINQLNMSMHLTVNPLNCNVPQYVLLYYFTSANTKDFTCQVEHQCRLIDIFNYIHYVHKKFNYCTSRRQGNNNSMSTFPQGTANKEYSFLDNQPYTPPPPPPPPSLGRRLVPQKMARKRFSL
jgi:hypothetical protein